jgi:hypothetical protein
LIICNTARRAERGHERDQVVEIIGVVLHGGKIFLRKIVGA